MKRLRRFDLPSADLDNAMIRVDGWQLVALVSVHGRGSLLDVDGLLYLAFYPVLFSV